LIQKIEAARSSETFLKLPAVYIEWHEMRANTAITTSFMLCTLDTQHVLCCLSLLTSTSLTHRRATCTTEMPPQDATHRTVSGSSGGKTCLCKLTSPRQGKANNCTCSVVWNEFKAGVHNWAATVRSGQGFS
jgi:hypothetical protein